MEDDGAIAEGQDAVLQIGADGPCEDSDLQVAALAGEFRHVVAVTHPGQCIILKLIMN